MTPPNSRPIFQRDPSILLNPIPLGENASIPASCPRNLCHESPKSNSQGNHPFFPDLVFRNRLIASSAFAPQKPVIAQVSPFLREESIAPLSSPALPQKVEDSFSKMPPELAKAFRDKGNEFFKLAQKAGLNVSERLNHFHTALFNFGILGDVESSREVLSKMQALYEKEGNDFGKNYVQAQVAFLQGDEKGFTTAIQLYESLDQLLRDDSVGLPRDQVDKIRADLRAKLSLAYISRGQLYLSEGQARKATLDLEQALYLNPNKAVFQLYAKAAYQSGLFDFADHDRQLEALRFQRNFLPEEYGSLPCNSHHQPPPSDFQIRQHQEKLRLHQEETDGKISAIQDQSRKNLEKFYQMVELVYPASNSAERYEKDLVSAEFLKSFGRPEEAKRLYNRIMTERAGSTDSAEVLRYATAANSLAASALASSPASARDYANQSLQALQKISSNAEAQFLIAQAKFIQVETYLKEGNLEAGRTLLEELKKNTPAGEKGSLQDKLLGQIYLRLAQVYYSKKDTFPLGDQLAEEIKTKFKGEAEIVGDTFFAKALSRVGTNRALEAVDILREEVQKPYPQSSAARAIAEDWRFKKFLTSYTNEKGETQYLLKACSEINEKDWSEAFKVAVAKSGEGPTERKVAYAAAGGGGVLAALALAPEPVATKVAAGLVAVGMGIGLLWERFVSASEHTDEIYDAYRTGFSNISDSQNTMNMLLLGTDVAMLLTAGMAGSVAKAFVREGLAVTAEEMTARWVLSAGVKVAGDDVAVWAGRFGLFVAENTASGLTSYTLYQAQRSLFLRENFHWNSSEALQWVMMSGFVEGASRLPFLGTSVAKLPAFQRGPLKDIVVNGKIVGQTTTEGLLAKWLIDAGFGLTAYYAWDKPKEGYADFMVHNIYMMGVLHGGGAAARKLTGGVPEAFIAKIDKRANEALAKAKDNILKDPPLGGGFGWQPAYAMVGGGVSTQGPVDASRLSPQASRPSYLFPMAMSSHLENLEADFRNQSGKIGNLPPDKVDQLRKKIKDELNENTDWRRALQGDFRFLESLTPEQLQAIETILRAGNTVGQQSGNTHLLYKMYQSGFLKSQILTLSSEALRAFSKMSGKISEESNFAERIFEDYRRWNRGAQPAHLRPANEQGILFEKFFDPTTSSIRTRLDLALEACFWLEAGKVEGAQAALDSITGEFFDSYRVRDLNAEIGYSPRGWRYVESPNEWRGNIDEVIRVGQLAREHVWRPYHSDALVKADHINGNIHPDALSRANWAEEYKSTYHQGNNVADFSVNHMKDPGKFESQVARYGRAVREGQINGVNYRITATQVDPAVIALIKQHIPNVRVIRYDSITDTKGEVLLDQHLKATEYPIQVGEAQKRAVQNNYPFTAENGEFITYRLPEKTEASPEQVSAFKDKILFYTETLNTKAMSSELASRIRGRAAIHVDWLARIYERMPEDRRAVIDSKVKIMMEELDRKLDFLETEEAKAALIYSTVESLGRDVIRTELPVWEKVPLGLEGAHFEGNTNPVLVNSPLDYIPGSLKLYLTDAQIRGPFQKLALRNHLRIPKGTRIYATDLTPHEAHASYSKTGAKPTELSRENVLGFEATLDFKNDRLFEKKTDEQGRLYYELKSDLVLSKEAYQLRYHGQNPKQDYFAPLRAAN